MNFFWKFVSYRQIGLFGGLALLSLLNGER